MKKLLILLFALSAVQTASFAGEVDVLKVDVQKIGNQYRFAVTVEHADEGWDHYADAWEVVGEDGEIYGKRVLAHPHVDEQPFTRSGTYSIPEGVTKVVIRAHDSVHGYGGKELTVDLPK